ncbi:MAG: PTS sugar transporter subunit IIA [Chloroflexi bacterium]|nr:PTS sugar transporter subunit IIA [Chloroflexota bacterium]
MVGFVIAAHGPLPDALLESLRMILGEAEQTVTVSLMPGDSLEGLVERLREAVQKVNTGEGVLIFLDLFGGTPSNASALLTQQIERVYAVTGANLPMLAEVFMKRQTENDVKELAATAVSAGQFGIVNVVEAFNKFRENS